MSDYGWIVVFFIFLISSLLIVKIFLFFHEKRKIRSKWVESYKYKKDGSIDLIRNKTLIDNIPNGSKCSCDFPDNLSTGEALAISFLTKEKNRKGPFYVKFDIGNEIREIFIKKNCYVRDF